MNFTATPVTTPQPPPWTLVEPDDEYHAVSRGGHAMSSGMLRKFRQCPYAYHLEVTGQLADKDTSAYRFGRAVHTIVLEGIEAFNKRYAIGGPVNPKTGKPFAVGTKAHGEWLIENGYDQSQIINDSEADALVKMANMVRRHEEASALLEYGEDSDMYRIRVLGEFPQQGALSIIPADRVHAALERRLPLDAVEYAPAILGVDPAWMGSDRSAIAMRKGIFAKVVFVGRQVDGIRLANIVARLQDEHQAAATFIDQTGVGASVCDQLGAIGRRFSPVAFGGAALDSGRFVNRRAEMWWEMREWFEKDVGLGHHQDLAEDLFGPEYGVNKGGKIYLESKDDMRKRGLASPDLGDALALTFAAPVRSRGGAPMKNTFSGNFDPYGALKRKGK